MRTLCAASTLRAPLCRSAARKNACRMPTVRCMSALQQKQQQQHKAEPVSAALALSSLALAGPALAGDEVAAAAGEAVDAAASGGIFGLTPLGLAFVLSPVVFYGAFNVYRSQVNPKANFGDAVFIFAALIIVANIVSITAFKVRLF